MTSHPPIDARKSEPHTTRAIWVEGPIVPRKAALPPKSSCDVCVVGAGITGLTTAYLLAQSGRSVIVLDQGEVGAGETSRTSAHLASALDEGFVRLEQLHGSEGARLAAESHCRAIDTIEIIVVRERIDCDFRRVDGFLFLGEGSTVSSLAAEADAAKRAGLEVEWLDVPPGPVLAAGPCIRFGAQAQFHPRRYLTGLVRAIERMGGVIHTRTHVTEFQGGDDAHVRTAEGAVVSAKALVIATNVPVNDRVVIHNKQAAHRSYVVALEIPRDAVPVALYWDTADPYHYVRVERPRAGDHDVLVVGGADHRTGDDLRPEGRWDQLESWARARFPMASRVIDVWSGQIMEPVDGLAFLGRNPADAPNVYVATGDSGHGLTHGTIGATMFLAMIRGEHPPYESLYDPRRISLRSLPTLAKEGWETAKHYADWVRPGDAKSEDDIPAGQGATLLVAGRRLAVYRDLTGRCHRLSATCRHLGGVVHWNAAESTWDCPCHGARYDRKGRMLNGPALDDLAPAEIPRAPEPVLVVAGDSAE